MARRAMAQERSGTRVVSHDSGPLTNQSERAKQKFRISVHQRISHVIIWYFTADIKCPYQTNSICSWTGQYQTLQVHYGKCPEVVIKCQERNCDYTAGRADVELHSQRCPHAKRRCTDCGIYTIRNHSGCRGEKMFCPLYCGSQLRRYFDLIINI